MVETLSLLSHRPLTAGHTHRCRRAALGALPPAPRLGRAVGLARAVLDRWSGRA
jgi:hypothetical protein